MLEDTATTAATEVPAAKTNARAAAVAAKPSQSISVDLDAGAFRNALSAVQRYADTSNTRVPILGCVTLIMNGATQVLHVTHYGIDMVIGAAVKAAGPDGAVAVPLRTLAAFMRGADGETVQVRKMPGDGRVTFACGDFSASIVPMVASDAPVLAGTDLASPNFRCIALAEGVMTWLLGLTVPFVSSEETRYYLNGVALEINAMKDGTLRAIATDGHRLGSRQVTLDSPPEQAPTVIVPIFAVKAVLALAAGKEVTLTLDDRIMEFAFGDFTIRTKLIDGTFPDWRRVVPTGPFKEFELDAGKIIKLYNASAGIRSSRTVAVKIEPHAEGMRVTAHGADMGDVSAVMRCDRPDGIEAFGVNGRYLKDMAAAFGGKKFRMGVTDSGGPMHIANADGPAGEFAVLMPMRLTLASLA